MLPRWRLRRDGQRMLRVRNVSPLDTFAMVDGSCALDGAECCRDGDYCDKGERCVLYMGVIGCCPNGDCSLVSTNSRSEYATPYKYSTRIYSNTKSTTSPSSTSRSSSATPLQVQHIPLPARDLYRPPLLFTLVLSTNSVRGRPPTGGVRPPLRQRMISIITAWMSLGIIFVPFKKL